MLVDIPINCSVRLLHLAPIDCRTLHNEKHNDLCNILNILKLIKTSRLRWLVYVLRMVENRNVYKILMWKL